MGGEELNHKKEKA